MNNPVNSFTRFLVGFLTFISLSFGLTYAIGMYEQEKVEKAQTAAAFAAMVGEAGR